MKKLIIAAIMSLSLLTTSTFEEIKMGQPFLVIVDGGVKIQLYLNSKMLSDELLEEFKLLDLGDIIGVEGVVFKTNNGELTVRASKFQLITKSSRVC